MKLRDVSPVDAGYLSAWLDRALDLRPDQRAQLLADLEVEHGALAATMAALLAAHDRAQASNLLETPLDLLAHPSLADEPVHAAGTTIGPYRLLRELGRGGMAVVWLAERADGAFTRSVALKIPHRFLFRRDLAERFWRERDIFARLKHPNIALL